ncbi:hypothetical protein [Streptosporangium roseum]|uniref:hypothetical protein n=1 Tax=Streptosporangium roseum TaxID=2001 RepID=UPI003325F9FB
MTGLLLDSGSTVLPWIVLPALGGACALAVHLLGRRGRLTGPSAVPCRVPRPG